MGEASLALADGVSSDEILVVWSEFDQNNQGYAGVRAQRLDELGVPLWGSAGREVSTVLANANGDGTDQRQVTIGVDNQGRAIIGWVDSRFDLGNNNNTDIFVQPIKVDGTPGY